LIRQRNNFHYKNCFLFIPSFFNFEWRVVGGIVASEDHTIPPDAERFWAKRMNAKVSEIKGSHVIFISQPALFILYEEE
jgi:hypothetical protein